MSELVDYMVGINNNPNVEKIYANGFNLALGNSDISIVLLLSGNPIALVNVSYTTAKTLQVRLGELVANFEATTKRTMLRTDEVASAFGKEQL